MLLGGLQPDEVHCRYERSFSLSCEDAQDNAFDIVWSSYQCTIHVIVILIMIDQRKKNLPELC